MASVRKNEFQYRTHEDRPQRGAGRGAAAATPSSGPAVVKVNKGRKLVAAGTAEDVEIQMELEQAPETTEEATDTSTDTNTDK